VIVSATEGVDPRPIVQPEGLGQRKITMTPSGIEPANIPLVVQCLNAVAYPGIFFGRGSTNSVEDRENGDLGW